MYTFFQVASATAARFGLSRGLLGLKYYQINYLWFWFFFRISSSHNIVNSVFWSHALVNGPTLKRPASDGGRYSGQLLMMWSICSGSPHSHAVSLHFFMDVLYRPTPVCSLFRVIQCFRLRSSHLTPSPGSDIWRSRAYSGGSGCFLLLLPRCRYPCVLRPVLRDDT